MYRLSHLDAVRHKGERAPQKVYVDALTVHGSVLASFGVKTMAHRAMILAQAAHETGGFTILRENLNYSAERIRQVWPSRPEAVRYAHDPEGLAIAVYGGRMGNRPGTKDGKTFAGAGLAQHTGRDGYQQVARIAGVPIVDNPDLVVTDARVAARALGGFWAWKKLGDVCPDLSEASIIRVTKRWNGGRIGLADRIVRVRKASRALGQTPMPLPSRPSADMVDADNPNAGRVAAGGTVVAGGGAASTVQSAPDNPSAIVAAAVLWVAVLAVAGVIAWAAYRRVKTALDEARRIEEDAGYE